jgi:hypothetical protein
LQKQFAQSDYSWVAWLGDGGRACIETPEARIALLKQHLYIAGDAGALSGPGGLTVNPSQFAGAGEELNG